MSEKKLKLDADQQVKVRQILEEKKQKMAEIWEQMKVLKEDFRSKVSAVLMEPLKMGFDCMMD